MFVVETFPLRSYLILKCLCMRFPTGCLVYDTFGRIPDLIRLLRRVDGIINLKFGEIFVLGSVKFNTAS